MSDQEDRQRANQAGLVKQLIADFNPVPLAELQKVIAASRKIAFDAHVQAGFTADQALALCR